MKKLEAEQNRLNEILILTDAYKIAKSLGIIENNYKNSKTNGYEIGNSVLNINTSNNNVPIWFLYGEKALLEKIESLKNRTNNDPYTPDLTSLKLKL